jgi:hypothetical protein
MFESLSRGVPKEDRYRDTLPGFHGYPAHLHLFHSELATQEAGTRTRLPGRISHCGVYLKRRLMHRLCSYQRLPTLTFLAIFEGRAASTEFYRTGNRVSGIVGTVPEGQTAPESTVEAYAKSRSLSLLQP